MQNDVLEEFTGDMNEDSNEIDRYINTKLSFSKNDSLLGWWNNYSLIFPQIALLAKSLFGVPASSATSERVIQPQTNNLTANPNIKQNPTITGGTNNVSLVTDKSNRPDVANCTASNNTDLGSVYPDNNFYIHRDFYSNRTGSSNPNRYHSNEYPYVASNVPINRDTTYNRAGYNGPTYSNINRRNSGYHSDLLIFINLVSNVDI